MMPALSAFIQELLSRHHALFPKPEFPDCTHHTDEQLILLMLAAETRLCPISSIGMESTEVEGFLDRSATAEIGVLEIET